MKSDDEILEAGGTQEDIANYAHDVGGACGAVYDGTCDHPTCEFNKNKSETMTNQASDLYELCKKVYELTKWDNYCEYWSFGGEYTVNKDSMTSIEVETAIIPLYTSDYLLEKLLPITSIQLKRKASGDIRLFYFPEKPDYATYDYDTPLKCLLALIIALSEAGELK